VTRGALVLGVALSAVGCASATPIAGVGELAGDWHGRVSGPAGHARAALVVALSGDYRGTMYLEGGDRSFHGALVVVRPGQVRYQGTDGNGTVRISEDNGRRRLRFLRDDGVVDGFFERR
jgi:hypothetical protein